MAYTAPTTAEKRAKRLARHKLAALVTIMAPPSGRETLKLNDVQSRRRADLRRGTTVELATGRGNGMYQLCDLEVVRHGKLNRAECRAVQPAAVEPEYGLLWADLTPVQRKALRKYRAGKKRERELAVAARQMRREGEIAEARRHLQTALAAAESTSIDYWHKRIVTLTGKNRPVDKQTDRYVSGRVFRKES